MSEEFFLRAPSGLRRVGDEIFAYDCFQPSPNYIDARRHSKGLL